MAYVGLVGFLVWITGVAVTSARIRPDSSAFKSHTANYNKDGSPSTDKLNNVRVPSIVYKIKI